MTRLSQRRSGGGEQSSVNPMDGLGNLADAMLVLAVGIMLALILNWKVDITAVSAAQTEPEDRQIELDENDLTDASEQTPDAEALDRVGALYFDEESGTYYAILGD